MSGAKGVKAGLDAVLKRAPNDALAWAVLGGWNGGSVASAGGFIARTILGASVDGMNAAFGKAMALEPANPAHPLIYALTLLNVSANNAPQAKELLAHAEAIPARDAVEAGYKAEGIKVLAVIGDKKAAQALARRLMPFGTVK